MSWGSNTLHFWYDASNKPAIVQFNGTKYAYLHNLQGDIVGIVDSAGNEVVKYIYDSWGKILSTSGSLASTLGTIQPFRYRGYVYDEETGLYYLRSRYYNPNWNRFANADALYRHNLFCYCYNIPVKYADHAGKALYCCFDDMGIGSPMVNLYGGGGSSGGYSVYTYTGSLKSGIDDQGRANELYKLSNALDDYLIRNFVKLFVNSITGKAIGVLLPMFFSTGVAGIVVGSVVCAVVGITGFVVGEGLQEASNNIILKEYNHQLGEEMLENFTQSMREENTSLGLQLLEHDEPNLFKFTPLLDLLVEFKNFSEFYREYE